MIDFDHNNDIFKIHATRCCDKKERKKVNAKQIISFHSLMLLRIFWTTVVTREERKEGEMMLN